MEWLSNCTFNANSEVNSKENCVNNSTSFDKLLITAPTWVAVNQDLRWIFPLHAYGFGVLFFVLSTYTFFSILNLRSLISSRPFMTSINIFLCLLGVSRSGCLFIDPYNLQETMPKIIGSIMWDIGFPCVTSAFCLIQLAFFQLTELKFGPEKLQKESCLSLVITLHFSCIIASNILLAFYNHFNFRYIFQAIFLAWGVFLYIMFLHAGYKFITMLKSLPNSVLARNNSLNNQRGIMQLALLAPYNNLATSVAAALVPTLLSQKTRPKVDNSDQPANIDVNEERKIERTSIKNENQVNSNVILVKKNGSVEQDELTSTVPEVYVRPPTPTPTPVGMNLPIITVSCPSRRSSVASSRRGSDISTGSRRSSVCSVRFINEEGSTNRMDSNVSPVSERSRTPERENYRRNSEMVSTSDSSRDIRRSSDFSHEKNRGSQFATKLRRNSDFGNRTPKRMMPLEETPRLPKVLDISPSGSRRNSDLGGLAAVRVTESRRNSDISYRRNSELANIHPLGISRRSSDVSIKTLDKSPTHFQSSLTKMEIAEKFELDSDQHDCNEKVSLMNNDEIKLKEENMRGRKKSLSWKNIDKCQNDDDDITAASSLLPDKSTSDSRIASTDLTLRAVVNHIAYVNRTKSDIPLQLPDGSTTANQKSQIREVLNITYATAILGILLCSADLVRILGLYGLWSETAKYRHHENRMEAIDFPKPWPWFIYQTICRLIELIMGCAMASITKQPSVSPRHQYFSNYGGSYNSSRFKHRDNPYI